MPVCSNCGKENRDGSRFCQSCGTPLVAPEPPKSIVSKKRSSQELAAAPVCSACGTLNAPGMKFCKMCGSALETAKGQAAKMICPSCGGQTPSGYKFCQHCGTPLARVNPAATPVGAPPASTPAPATAAPAVAPAATTTAANSAASLTAPAGASPIQVQAVVAAVRPAPITPNPLQAALAPAVDLVGAAAATPPDQARTIIEMAPSRTPGEIKPAQIVVPPAPVIVEPAPVRPAPSFSPAPAPASSPWAVMASSATVIPGGAPGQATAPAVMPVEVQRAPGRATVGPGATKDTDVVMPAEQRLLARVVSVNRDGTDGDVHPVTEECFDLGRTDGHLRFPDDPYLSERHCRFSIRNGHWQIQDLQSCNGVFLRITGAAELRHGDRILLGKQVLVFELLGEHERTLAPAVEHGVLVFGSPLRTPWARLRQSTVAGIFRDVYYLYRPRVTIGREEGDWVFPDDEFMSRQHLTLSQVGAKAQMQDLQSSNGTFVQIREPQELQNGTLLRVGDQLLRFQPM